MLIRDVRRRSMRKAKKGVKELAVRMEGLED